MLQSSKNILLIMTGSIACYKACAIVSSLHQKGYVVKVVLSPSSLHFIGASTIEGLTGQPAITEMYAVGSAMDHIKLDRWADLIVVAPATANFINKIANGIGDDLLTTLFLAHDFKKPFLLAPAMNTMMYQHPTTQESLKKLKSFGVEILETASGVLACGEVGYGRLLDPQLIIQEVENRLVNTNETEPSNSKPKMKPLRKVLITAGGTTEPIDDIRSITNTSTGKTAAFIADQLIESGIDVHFLHAKNSVLPVNECAESTFFTFDDLSNELNHILKLHSFDAILHLAAVSDYSVAKQSGKISSDAEHVNLKLIKNKKLINEIKKLNPNTVLIGFKLTSLENQSLVTEKVNKLFKDAQCDYVVQNDWNDIKNSNHQFKFFNPSLGFKSLKNVQELSLKIFKTITEIL